MKRKRKLASCTRKGSKRMATADPCRRRRGITKMITTRGAHARLSSRVKAPVLTSSAQDGLDQSKEATAVDSRPCSRTRAVLESPLEIALGTSRGEVLTSILTSLQIMYGGRLVYLVRIL